MTEIASLAEQAAAAGAGLQTLFQTLIELKETQDNDRRQAIESRQNGENEIYDEMRKLRGQTRWNSMFLVMVKMISESRWTGTTLKFGLNIEQSFGHSVAEGQPRLLGRRPPTLSSTLPTR